MTSATTETFADSSILVTGAAGALGRAVTSYFLERGGSLICLDYSLELLQQAFGTSRAGRLQMLAADLTSRHSCESALGPLVNEKGGPQIVANLAGGFRMGEAVHETSDENWDFLFDLNLRAIVNVAAVIVPAMQRQGGGKIINVAARAGLFGDAGMGAYSASKSGVLRLTESMAAELRHQHINVNCVLPSIMDTPANRREMPDADFSSWAAVDDVARVIGFLASDEARAVHGAGIAVYGLV